MENKSHAFLAGLFVLLLGATALAALYWLGGGKDETNDYVVVTKQNIGGLNPQAQVRYRGIRVGKVSDIRLDPEDYTNILITILVNDDVPLTQGTVAKLNYQGVTGLANILLLETGKLTAPLEPNDANPPRITMVPSLVDELGETGAAALRQSKQFLDHASAVLDDENRTNLKTSLANLAIATAALKPTLDNLNETLVQFRKLANDKSIAHLADSAAQIPILLGETRVFVSKLQATTDRVNQTLGGAGGDDLLALLPRLNETVTEFSQTSRQLSRILGHLDENPQSLLFGAPLAPPGPGEPGFIMPAGV